MEDNLTYLQRRASQEESAALHAALPRARQAHLDLAREYERRIAAGTRKSEAPSGSPTIAEPEAAGLEPRAAGIAS